MYLFISHASIQFAPRFAAGACHIVGAVLAGFGAFSLWQMRREERAAVTTMERRRSSTARYYGHGSSSVFYADDAEAARDTRRSSAGHITF